MISLSDLKKVLGLTLITAFLFSGFYVVVEPGLSIAATTATVVVTMSVTAGVAVTVDNAVSPMSTALGVTQNTSIGTSTFVVTTNDNLGYTLKLNASTTAPAMQSATNNFPDVTVTPTLYSAPLIASGSYGFGFSAYSTTTSDVNTTTYGTQTTGCGSAPSVPATALKYRGFAGNTQIIIAGNTSTTTTAGNATVVCYVAGQNNAYAPSGNYTATITATALTN